MSDLFSPIKQGEVRADGDNGGVVDYVAELVGPGKKFPDVQNLAKGKYESDLYIKRLEQEREEQRRDLEARLSVEDFIKEMKKEKNSILPSQVPQVPEGERRNDQPQVKPGMSPEEIASLVEKQISQKEDEKQRRENVVFARNELLKQWGQTFPEKLKLEAGRLGVSEEFLSQTAEKAPMAFLKLLGVQPEGPSKASTYQAPPKNEMHVVIGNTEGSTNLKWEDYEKLRKENPRRYWSRQVQSEIHKLAASRGASFINK